MRKGKALLAVGLAGFLVLGLQVPAHAKTAESSTGLAVANTVTESFGATEAPGINSTSIAVTVTVQPGDTLSGLAVRHCGSSTWQAIYQDNAAVVGSNPNLIYPGQQLAINCAASSTQQVATPAPAGQTNSGPSSGWVDPFPGHCISSGYGMRWGSMHNGVDLGAGNANPPIRAAAAGTVSIQWNSGGGNMTMIDHGGGLWTVYMHQAWRQVTSGWVNAGTVIGYAGATGNAQGNHLHFEVHPYGLWGTRVNPVDFMSDRGVYLGC